MNKVPKTKEIRSSWRELSYKPDLISTKNTAIKTYTSQKIGPFLSVYKIVCSDFDFWEEDV